MRIIVYRTFLAEGFTLGRMYFDTADGKPRYVCDTLEPQVRQKKVADAVVLGVLDWMTPPPPRPLQLKHPPPRVEGK